MDQENQETRSPPLVQEGDSNDSALESLTLEDGSSSEAEIVMETIEPANEMEVQNDDGVLHQPIQEQSALGMPAAIDPQISQAIDPPINQAIDPPINQAINPLINQAINPPINQAIDPPINQAIEPDNGSDRIGADFRPIGLFIPCVNFPITETAEERANANVVRRFIEEEASGSATGNRVVVIVRRNGVTGPRSSTSAFASRFPPVDAFNAPRDGDPRYTESTIEDPNPNSAEPNARTSRRRCPRSFSIFY